MACEGRVARGVLGQRRPIGASASVRPSNVRGRHGGCVLECLPDLRRWYGVDGFDELFGVLLEGSRPAL